MIILISAQVAKDLLQLKGAIYSDRPISTLYKMLVIFFEHLYQSITHRRCRSYLSEFVSFMNYGDSYKARSRIMQKYLSPQACMELRPLQVKNAHGLLVNLLDTPEDFIRLVDR